MYFLELLLTHLLSSHSKHCNLFSKFLNIFKRLYSRFFPPSIPHLPLPHLPHPQNLNSHPPPPHTPSIPALKPKLTSLKKESSMLTQNREESGKLKILRWWGGKDCKNRMLGRWYSVVCIAEVVGSRRSVISSRHNPYRHTSSTSSLKPLLSSMRPSEVSIKHQNLYATYPYKPSFIKNPCKHPLAIAMKILTKGRILEQAMESIGGTWEILELRGGAME